MLLMVLISLHLLNLSFLFYQQTWVRSSNRGLISALQMERDFSFSIKQVSGDCTQESYFSSLSNCNPEANQVFFKYLARSCVTSTQ